MGLPEKPGLVKRFCGLIYSSEEIYNSAKDYLRHAWGTVDLEAGPWPFTFTDYYKTEMGPDLKRRFLSFSELLCPENTFSWKIFTNQLEQRFLVSANRRQINLDPGYLDLSRLVLLTTKDFSHRIYLAQGIYAEITLVFQGGQFRPLPWTYPDYRTEEYLKFFHKMRQLYLQEKNRHR